MSSRPSIPPQLASARGHIREAMVSAVELRQTLAELRANDEELANWRERMRKIFDVPGPRKTFDTKELK